jgi:hypothetical protein
MQRWVHITCLGAFLAAIMDTAVAQGPGGPEPPKSAQISGVVIDAMDGHSLRRATVCLRPGADGGYSTTRGERCDETDEKGAFVLAGMLPARYSIGVDREGGTLRLNHSPKMCLPWSSFGQVMT